MTDRYVIYSKDGCPYCDKARDLLRYHGKEFIEYKLDRDFTRETMKVCFPTAKTYPVITENGEYIGGFTDLEERYKNEDRIRIRPTSGDGSPGRTSPD